MGHRASEDDIITSERGLTPYVRSRLQAENIVLRYAKEHGLPAVAMCVSTTYGSGDWGRTPHGAIIAGAAFGKLPFVMSGIELEAVGVDDAARAMILAAEHGRVGERYLISEKMISNAEVVRIAAEAARYPAADEVDSAGGVLCVGHRRQRQGEAARNRRAALAGLAAADASRSSGGPQQGQSRIGLGAKACRGVHPRGRPVLGRPARRQAKEQDSLATAATPAPPGKSHCIPKRDIACDITFQKIQTLSTPSRVPERTETHRWSPKSASALASRIACASAGSVASMM